ncbi:hypothetical protein LSTR_LSTR003061 [Laodelphax striatellus]|uniref:Protein stoned-B n=1 Tax=Laodelphax striatellus TaxID=195883 RepID=A0A482WX69_LAOST|nr:hypothetical protein LSTR_LSTR003061 [Laodelphax striatellus]
MANPFLMSDMEPVKQPAGFNPFLSGGDFGGGVAADPSVPDNPFMSSTVDDSSASSGYQSATNPFASSQETNNFFTSAAPSQQPTNVDFTNIFASQPAQPGVGVANDFSNIFASPAPNAQATANDFTNIFASEAPVPPSNVDLFDSFAEPAANTVAPLIAETMVPTPTPAVTSTANLLDEEAEFFPPDEPQHSNDVGAALPPKRPPPPPRPPPSKETKDLILSVTGAMEATSSHLLDRLQATRTPSPTPIRELHSPSPTPDMMQVTDLLGGGFGPVMEETQHDEAEVMDLLGSGDAYSQPATGQPFQQPDSFQQLEPFKQSESEPFGQPQPFKQPETYGKPEPFGQPETFKQSEPFGQPEPFGQAEPFKQTEPFQQADLFQQSSEPFQQPAAAPFQHPVRPQPPVQPPSSSISMLSMTPSPEPIVSMAPSPTPAAAPPPRPAQPAVPERPKVPPQPLASGPPPKPPPPTIPSRPKHPPFAAPKPEPVEPAKRTDAEEEANFFAAPAVQRTSVPKEEPSITGSSFLPTATTGNDLFFSNSAAQEVTKPVEDNFTSSQQQNVFSQPAGIFSPPKQQQVAEDIFAAPAQPAADIFGVPPQQPVEDVFVAPAPAPTQDLFSPPKPTSGADIFGTAPSAAAQAPDLFSPPKPTAGADIFGSAPTSTAGQDLFSAAEPPVTHPTSYNIFDAQPAAAPVAAAAPVDDAFDAFAAKFESVGHEKAAVDPFDAFGAPADAAKDGPVTGFGADDNFDAFLALQEPPPVPQSTPARVSRGDSKDSDDNDNDFNIFIKPKSAQGGDQPGAITPVLAPPPRSPVQNAFQDSSPRFNPFDAGQDASAAAPDSFFAQAQAQFDQTEEGQQKMERTDSQETPPTPLFDDDVSQPLEDFPRIHYDGPGWEMFLRQPNKKKITGQRFWKKIFVKLVYQGENPVIHLFNNKDEKDPFQELPLQPCYSVSEIAAQQYDQYGKIFTVKLQFIFYKERPGVRPGQVTKAERLTNKLSQFAAYAIQGDYQGCKEFGSDLKKLGLPVEHAPQISQLYKIGSFSFEDMKQMSVTVEEALFRLSAHRDRALNYKMEEVQITAVDELYVEQNKNGGVDKQIARVRLFFLGFLSGMPDIELGVNDMVRQGKEVVGRHDIIPVVTEEWIRLEAVEFHSCIQQDEYERTRTIKFKPPDASYIELMRFRVRPPKNRELPLQLKTVMCVTGNKVELRADVLVPGFASRKLGQIPCEDVMIRFPIPECWIYLFRVEKHFRYGSVKSAHRRSGKVKGIERFLGAVDNLEPSLMEVTSGQAKYEHQHRAIVWRMPRLPKEGQGAYTTHNLVCRMALTSYDQIPDQLAQYAYVEFTMPATQVSHTTVRSVSICNSDSDTPPEKYVRQLARHEYVVEIEHTQGESPADYIAATAVSKPPPAPIAEEKPPSAAASAAESDSDSSS